MSEHVVRASDAFRSGTHRATIVELVCSCGDVGLIQVGDSFVENNEQQVVSSAIRAAVMRRIAAHTGSVPKSNNYAPWAPPRFGE